MNRDHCGVVKAWETTIKRTQAVAKKRAESIFFCQMSVAHVDEEEEGQRGSKVGDVYHVDRVLPNGDYYTGHWCDNFPQGQGKYLWTDGCMYVGEWFRGKTMGRGRFSWPSGATYEGEFKSGYMDGKGTYTGANGDTYRGNWAMNFKHGRGIKSYCNGDQYEGEWRRGIPEGRGKYLWTNGHHYVGEWKDGVIYGQGTLMWYNGNRYDGFWADGVPKGTGTFRWADGSFYMGFWSKDPAEQKGTYCSSGVSLDRNLDWDPQVVFNVDLMECKVCLNEKVSVLPSQKKLAVWRSSKDVEPNIKPKRMSVDSRLNLRADRDLWVDDRGLSSAVIGVDLDDGLEDSNTDDMDSSEGSVRHMARMVVPKRQGRIICKGHKNYDLMLNLQLGIRHSVGRPGPIASLDLKASAFDPKTKVWTRFPPGGSKHTPPHQSCDFKWKDYCPIVFRTLRKLFNVDAADYMISICGNDALREFSSPGKSGSFFYLTNDDRYMIKTMKKAEAKVLIRMLSAYYNHVRSFENTLVTKFFGLHCLKLTGTAQKKVRFIIMGNLFCTDYAIHRRFDLKGSSLGRMTDKPLSEIDETTILKDLDLNFIFRLQKSWFQEFCRQIDRDSEFLEQERIMDYSLLVGLHFRDPSVLVDFASSGSRTPSGHSENDTTVGLSNVDMDQILIDSTKWDSVRLGINMAAKAERTGGEGCGGEMYEVVMFFGIIDILQDYDISKKLEHAYKSFQYDPTSISAVDPKQYSKRFRDFIFSIFTEDACFQSG